MMLRRFFALLILACAALSPNVSWAGNADLSPEWPFNVETTNLAADDIFQFKISASGTFMVDCDGVTLSESGVSGNTITKGDTADTTYTCTYSTAGTHTIRFGGLADGYNTGSSTAAISFYVDYSNVQKIARISGSLGAIFPTLNPGTNNEQQPRFYNTFCNAKNMTGTIPAKLFAGVSGAPVSYMFYQTFAGSGVTGYIPSTLFSGISGTTESGTFNYTFYGCEGLTGYVPYDLFRNIDGLGTKLYIQGFNGTFMDATSMDTRCPDGVPSLPTPKPFGNPAGSWGLAALCDGVLFSCPDGYEHNADAATESECQIMCPAGQWVATDGGACVNVESGFYSTGLPVNYGTTGGRSACPTGLTTTGSGVGADEENDCGRILHIGGYELRLRSGEPRTHPALHVRISPTLILHADMAVKAPGTPGRGHLRTKIGGQVWSIFNMDVDE